MTIVADPSAFVAILQKEPDAVGYCRALLDAVKVLISVATSVELHIVITMKLGAEGVLRLLEQPFFEMVPVYGSQAIIANQAYERFW